jgi:tyrosyl-tRNA synthetase
MNAHDDDIERYLKLLTLLELNDIDDIVSEHKLSPELRV